MWPRYRVRRLCRGIWTPASPPPRCAALQFPCGFVPAGGCGFSCGKGHQRPNAAVSHPGYPRALETGDWQYVVVPLSSKPAEVQPNEGTSRIKGRLVETGIMVQTLAQVTVQGVVSIDDVRLRESSEIFTIDGGAQVGPPLPGSSELAPRLGVNSHLLRDEPQSTSPTRPASDLCGQICCGRMLKDEEAIASLLTMRSFAHWRPAE